MDKERGIKEWPQKLLKKYYLALVIHNSILDERVLYLNVSKKWNYIEADERVQKAKSFKSEYDALRWAEENKNLIKNLVNEYSDADTSFQVRKIMTIIEEKSTFSFDKNFLI